MTFGQSILVVEDDDELRSVLSRGLREEGFAVEGVATGAALLERVDHFAPDALVIDIGLPDADGRDVCQALRARGNQTPVLFLTFERYHLLLAGIAAVLSGVWLGRERSKVKVALCMCMSLSDFRFVALTNSNATL